jgi:6-pyruvoyl-tetrahydropterin synthase
MFSVTVRDHVMIAHSFTGEAFGPAQRLHGATYVIDVTFRGPELGPEGILVDIGSVAEQLKDVLAGINYRNLDDLDRFAGINTSTEAVARWVADELAARFSNEAQLSALEVTLHESHIASAGYQRPLGRSDGETR